MVTWRKSSHSNGATGCVDVAWASGKILVRDSKDPGGGTLAFPPEAWAEFIAAVKAGRWR